MSERGRRVRQPRSVVGTTSFLTPLFDSTVTVGFLSREKGPSMLRVRSLWGMLGLTLTIVASGCGPAKTSVEGTVTLDGKAVEGALVSFIPDGDGAQPAQGETDKDGHFKIKTNNIDGVAHGKYKVTITKTKAMEGPGNGLQGADAYKAMMAKGQLNTTTRSAVPKSELPAKYSSAETSGLNCTVPTAGQLKFELSGK